MKKTFIIIMATLCFAACKDTRYYRISGYAQGGTWQVKYRGARLRPEKVQAGVDSLLSEIDYTLSGYNKASLLSRLNAGDSVVLSRRFFELYEHSYRMWEASQGAFDVASGPLFDIWGFGFTSEQLPSEELVARTLSSCGTGRLISPSELESKVGSRICSRDLLKDREAEVLPRLNFNAIAQGYSCDVVAQYLRSLGVSDMLVDIGEIYCCGLNPSGKGWSIGIDNPVDGNNTPGADIKDIWVSDGGSYGVVTSGNYRKFYVRDGKKYSHTIDPRSGYPVTHNLLSATVIAPSAWEADALATWFMVIGYDEARRYLASHPELHACLITSDSLWKNF